MIIINKFTRKLLATGVLLFGLVQHSLASLIPVDVELSLVIDVSASVNNTEYNLMMDGYADAFRDAAIQSKILGGTNGSIAVNTIFFSSRTVVGTDWSLLDSVSDINTFANTLDSLSRPLYSTIGTYTAIGYGISIATDSFNNNNYEGIRKVMDVSGDGTNNYGTDPTYTRSLASAQNIIINGITIGGGSNLTTYYKDNVITSDGFVVSASSFTDFATAVNQKILKEVSTTVPEPGSLALLGLGLLGFGVTRKAKK